MLLLVLGSFLSVGLAIYVVYLVYQNRMQEATVVKSRLAVINAATTTEQTADASILRDEMLSQIPFLERLLAQAPQVLGLKKYLSQAGINLRIGTFVLICALCALVGGTLCFTFTRDVLYTFIAGVIFSALPIFWLQHARSARFNKFEEQLPDAIDMLSRAIRAGHPFSASLEMLSTEMPQPLAGEFLILHEQQKFGLPLRDALFDLAERMPLVDVKFFVTSVLLQRETGGNLAEILDKLAYVMRERFKILRQIRVHTAQGRLSMMILMALPPTVGAFSYFINREFMQVLFTDPMGKGMLAYAVISQTIGYFVIRKIIDIKV